MQARAGGMTSRLNVGTELAESQGVLLLPWQLLLLLAQQAETLFEPRAPRLQLVEGQRFGRLRLYQPLNLALGRAPRVLELADPRTRVGGQ